MATYTTNYNLEKPDASDPFEDFRESYNDNLDIIDANLGGGGGDYYYPIIYSETERQIGVWVDNKPLYKKTWDLGSAGMSINAQTWVNTAILKDDFDMIVGVEGENGDGAVWDILGARGRSSSSAYVQIYSTRNSSITVRYLTLYYTKISDVAGSGNWNAEGVPTVHYTTTEQVVGTWLGKPLYQQSIPFSGLNISGNTNYTFDVSSYAINAERIFLDLDMSFYIVNNVQRSFIPATVSPVQPPYVLFRVETNRNNASGYITIRYTKTTD